MQTFFFALLPLFLGAVVQGQAPTSGPAGSPNMPSAIPTYSEPFEIRQEFSQIFVKVPIAFLDDSEKQFMMDLYASYTPRYIPDDVPADRINTVCAGDGEDGLPTQLFVDCRPEDPCGNITDQLLYVWFYCTWSSNVTEVEFFPQFYRLFMNFNLEEVSQDLRSRGVNITQALIVEIPLPPSPPSPPPPSPPPPTNSPAPEAPTKSPAPSPLPIRIRQHFSQSFVKVPRVFFDESEKQSMMELYASYTPRYIPDGVPADQISMVCAGDGDDGLPTQRFVDCRPEDPCENSTDQLLDVLFDCAWSSSLTNIEFFPHSYRLFMNFNLEEVSQDLRSRGVNITQALKVTLETPSLTPSAAPTGVKAEAPTKSPSPSELPPAGGDDGGLSVDAIVGIVVGSGFAVLAGLIVFYYRRTRKPRAQEDGFYSEPRPVADLVPPDAARLGGEAQPLAAHDVSYSPAYKDCGRSVAGESSPNVARVSQTPVFAEAVLVDDEDQQ